MKFLGVVDVEAATQRYEDVNSVRIYLTQPPGKYTEVEKNTFLVEEGIEQDRFPWLSLANKTTQLTSTLLSQPPCPQPLI